MILYASKFYSLLFHSWPILATCSYCINKRKYMSDSDYKKEDKALKADYYSQVGFFKEYAAICIKSGSPSNFKNWAKLSTRKPLINLSEELINYKPENEYKVAILKEIIVAFDDIVIKSLYFDINLGPENGFDDIVDIIMAEIRFQGEYYSKLLMGQESTLDLNENIDKINPILIHLEHVTLGLVESKWRKDFGTDLLKLDLLKAYNLLKSIFNFRSCAGLDSDASLSYFIDYYLNMLVYLNFKKNMNIFDFFNYKAFGETIDTSNASQNEHQTFMSNNNNCYKAYHIKYKNLADVSYKLNYYLNKEEEKDIFCQKFPILGSREELLYEIWHPKSAKMHQHIQSDPRACATKPFDVSDHVTDDMKRDTSALNEQFYSKSRKRQSIEERQEPNPSTSKNEEEKKKSSNTESVKKKPRESLEISKGDELNEAIGVKDINSNTTKINDSNNLEYYQNMIDKPVEQNKTQINMKNTYILSISEILDRNPNYKYKDIYNSLKNQGYLKCKKYYGSLKSLNIPSFIEDEDYKDEDILRLNLTVYILSFHQFYLNNRLLLNIIRISGYFTHIYFDAELRIKLFNYLREFHLPIKEMMRDLLETLKIFKNVMSNIKKLGLDYRDHGVYDITDENYDKVSSEDLLLFITIEIPIRINKLSNAAYSYFTVYNVNDI